MNFYLEFGRNFRYSNGITKHEREIQLETASMRIFFLFFFVQTRKNWENFEENKRQQQKKMDSMEQKERKREK